MFPVRPITFIVSSSFSHFQPRCINRNTQPNSTTKGGSPDSNAILEAASLLDFSLEVPAMTEEIDYQDYRKALQFDQRVSRMGPMKSILNLIVEQLSPMEDDVVLDVGTGTGRLGMAVQVRVPHGSIVGLDSGRGMLRVAREKVMKQGATNFLLVRGTAEQLPFHAGIYNSACMMLSFHHFADPLKALQELHVVLKAGGHLVSLDPVLQEPASDLERRLNESIEEAFQEAHGPHFRFFTYSQLQRLYEDAGFIILSVQPYEMTFEKQSMETLPMGPHWLQARENLWFRQQKDVLKAFEEKYFKFQTTGSGLSVTGKMKWAVFKAVKSVDRS